MLLVYINQTHKIIVWHREYILHDVVFKKKKMFMISTNLEKYENQIW